MKRGMKNSAIKTTNSDFLISYYVNILMTFKREKITIIYDIILPNEGANSFVTVFLVYNNLDH